MKKTLFSVMWLAIAGVFTITALSACSDDDNENKSGSYVIQKNGVVEPSQQVDIECSTSTARTIGLSLPRQT